VGKTTTIGKLAAKFHGDGKTVLPRMRILSGPLRSINWSSGRTDETDVIRHQADVDSAAVAYDAVTAAIARKTDVVIVDTAGRLHTKKI
jgi:fused signal recognition particle receptor